MLDGVMGEVFKFIGINVVGLVIVIPMIKVCLNNGNNKIHKNKQFKRNKNKNEKQWFYDVA